MTGTQTGVVAGTLVPPIAASLTRARERISYCAVAYGPLPDDALRAADIVGCPECAERVLTQVADLYGTEQRRLAASYMVLGYFWDLAVGALACYALDRRVPDLAPDTLAMQLGAGVVFSSPRCSVLPDDPARGQPGVEVVADRDALRERLLAPLEELHAQATLRDVARHRAVGRQRHAREFSDRVVSALLWIAQASGDPDFAQRETPLVVARLGPRTRAGVLPVVHNGQHGTYQLRAGCCLTYKLPGREKCETCPLTPLDERVATFRARLVEGAHTY